MPQSKTYIRKCEMCGFQTTTSGNWSRHNKTKKHLKHVRELEDKNKTLELKLLQTENALLKLQVNNTTNITNNVDVSNIQINIFTPNEKANNLSDVVMPTLLELAKQEVIPSKAIQQVIMKMEERMRPILYHKNILYVKQDIWKKDNEAEKELQKFCNNKYSILNKEFDEMDNNLGSETQYLRCCEYARCVPLDKDSITHKLKTKLIQQ